MPPFSKSAPRAIAHPRARTMSGAVLNHRANKSSRGQTMQRLNRFKLITLGLHRANTRVARHNVSEHSNLYKRLYRVHILILLQRLISRHTISFPRHIGLIGRHLILRNIRLTSSNININHTYIARYRHILINHIRRNIDLITSKRLILMTRFNGILIYLTTTLTSLQLSNIVTLRSHNSSLINIRTRLITSITCLRTGAICNNLCNVKENIRHNNRTLSIMSITLCNLRSRNNIHIILRRKCRTTLSITRRSTANTARTSRTSPSRRSRRGRSNRRVIAPTITIATITISRRHRSIQVRATLLRRHQGRNRGTINTTSKIPILKRRGDS